MRWEGCLVTVKLLVEAHQVPVSTIFGILHEKLTLVKKLSMRLQIWCAHFVGRRRDPGSQKYNIFAWYVLGSVFPVTQRKETAVCHQAEPGGDEDNLGGGGGGILWSKTSSPPTSGGGRSPLKSAFWWVIYRRKILRKYIFLYKEQFLFNFVCLIWFWLHYVFAALSTILPSILYTVSWKGKDFVCFLLSMEHHFCVKQKVFLLSCAFAVDW